MEIRQPRRILFLSPPDTPILQLLTDLTGSAPAAAAAAADGSTAGLTHTWRLRTAYYAADVPVWLDEVRDAAQWAADFCDAAAREVVCAVAAWVYVFRRPVGAADYEQVMQTLAAVQRVIATAAGPHWDGTCLAVALVQRTTPHLAKSADAWDEACRAHGFEYVDAEATGRNEYNENVGLARIKDAMEATDWQADDNDDTASLDELDDETFASSFAAEEAEMSLELLGIKEALAGQESGGSEDEAERVEEMERMMTRLLAVKDTASAMPLEERKRFAKRAVDDLMRGV